MCFLETKVKEINAQRIQNAIDPGWNFVHNYQSHRLGRIWLCWDSYLIQVKYTWQLEQLLHVKILMQAGEFMTIFIYALNDGMDRRQLWRDLEDLKQAVGGDSWMLAAGDFEVVKSPIEKSGKKALTIYEKEFGIASIPLRFWIIISVVLFIHGVIKGMKMLRNWIKFFEIQPCSITLTMPQWNFLSPVTSNHCPV